MKIICFISFFFSALLTNTVSGQDSLRALNLGDALDFAVQRNLQLKSSEIDIAIQNKEVLAAGIRPNPVFNMQILALTDPTLYPDYPLYTSEHNRQDWFQLTKKMQLYGIRQEKIALEEKQLSQTMAAYNSERREVLYQVANTWLEAWFAQANQYMANEAIMSLDSLIQHKQTDGLPSKNNNEYLRLLILDDQYDIIHIDAELALRNQLNDLQYLLNSGYIYSVNEDDQLNLVDIPNNVDSLIAIAMRMRSDISMYHQSVLVSEANQTLQKSNTMPVPEMGFIVNPQNTIPYAGIFFTQPLPVFDHNQGEKQKAVLALQQARLEEDAVLLRVQAEVRKAYESYRIQQQKMAKVQDALALAAQLVSHVRTDYIKNHKSYVDLWEAEITWFDTEKMYYRTEYEYRKSIIDLLYYTGLLEQL